MKTCTLTSRVENAFEFETAMGEPQVGDDRNEGRVQVNFKRAGSKWLALEYAKLTAI